MRCSLRVSVAGLLIAALGCYHATVETGLTPSNQTVEKSFASGWILGLIPPSTVETASKCPNGAAKIEIEKWNSRKPQTSYVPIAGSAWVIGLLPPISCATFGGRKRFGRRVKRSVAAAT